MTRELAMLIMVLIAALLITAGVFAWRRRAKRDSSLKAPVGEIPTGATALAEFSGLYVATTKRDEPLERLAIRGLAFRSRADLVVTTHGIALDLTGKPRLFIPTGHLDDVAQATVAIDRVVERDGLVRVSWSVDEDSPVDSYFRAQGASARAVVDAIRTIPHHLLPAHPQTTPGSNA
jgi:hypothetical protein